MRRIGVKARWQLKSFMTDNSRHLALKIVKGLATFKSISSLG